MLESRRDPPHADSQLPPIRPSPGRSSGRNRARCARSHGPVLSPRRSRSGCGDACCLRSCVHRVGRSGYRQRCVACCTRREAGTSSRMKACSRGRASSAVGVLGFAGIAGISSNNRHVNRVERSATLPHARHRYSRTSCEDSVYLGQDRLPREGDHERRLPARRLCDHFAAVRLRDLTNDE